jgi:hypothetical protein
MIHGGLQINLKKDKSVYINHCCLRIDTQVLQENEHAWNNKHLEPLRQINEQNVWASGCENCESLEKTNLESFRTGSLKKFGKRKNLSGPTRLDLMFDISCNLACRICGPNLSTYWQHHLKQSNIPFNAVKPEHKQKELIEILRTLDLSNLEMVVFCGGETLLGSSHWDVVEALIDMVPNAKNELTISFQTNGTQGILDKHFKIIEKLHLLKLNVSLDGVGDKFEYLRWPAQWNQVVDNLNKIKEQAPVNTMFLVEETVSIFNLLYLSELEDWIQKNYSTNRLGDIINHTRHLAVGEFRLAGLTQEYVDAITKTKFANLVPKNWEENPKIISEAIRKIKQFDLIRNQNWNHTFPEVAQFYARYL